MVIIFLIILLVCGGLVAALGAKLFADAKKGSSFMGVTLADGKPAIAGIVVGAVVILCAMVVFFALRSDVSGLSDRLERSEGNLRRKEKELGIANDKVKELTKKFEKGESELEQAQKETNKLKKDLEAKELERATVNKDAQHLKQTLETVRQKLGVEARKAENYRSERDIAKAMVDHKDGEIGRLKSVIEKEKQFRREYKALVEEEEAAPSANRNKLYFKLMDLLNKYRK